MTDQNSRLNRARLVGAVIAFPLGAWLPIFAAFDNFPGAGRGIALAILTLGGLASISAALAITFVYMRAMRRKENRKRGVWIGMLTGVVALFFMAWVIGWGVALSEIFVEMNHALAVSGAMPAIITLLMKMLSFPFVFTLVGFIFGGFLVIPFGGWLGWAFSRNPDDQTPANPNPK